MQVTIKVYSKSKQTRKDEKGIPQSSIATRTIDTLTYEVTDGIPVGKALAQVNHFAQRVIGARYKAILGAGKKMPAKLFFSVDLSGKVYSSETSLVKANMVQLIAVSAKSLEGKEGTAIIDTVAGIQGLALKQSVGYLSDVATIAKQCEGFDGTAVKSSTMLVNEAGELAPATRKPRKGRKEQVVTVIPVEAAPEAQS